MPRLYWRHATSLLVAFKLISVNLFNLRHLCSGFKIPDSKIVLDHLGRGYPNRQNQGIHGSDVETWHATSLQVAYKLISVNLSNLRHQCSGFKIPDSKFKKCA